ncbi:MAG TPA: mandelate racemase/muconate lactonizing enzyme family protein [Chloroflexota bacterium]|nr:mandelate racemase/muconate lactonizing enzyme family protein [Chloroflexota bacterium]
MKITGHRIRVARVPYEENRAGIHFVLQLQTDEGIEGVSYVSRIGAVAVKPCVDVLDAFCTQVHGKDPINVEAINATFNRRTGALPGFQERAQSAIDVACWDIRGKAVGQPVYKLLGGHRDRIPTYASWNIEEQPAAQLAKHAEEHVKRGFKAMKWHTRGRKLKQTVEHMRVVREAVGPDVEVMVDNTQLWDVKEAISIGRALLPYNPYWLEDAVPKEDYDGLRQVSEALPEIQTCAGEGYRAVHNFRELLEHRSVDIAMIDLDLGLTGSLKVAHLAEAYGKPVVPHLATEIYAHLMAAVPNGLTVEYIPWVEPLFKGLPWLDPKDGQLALPSTPGLGLDIDEAGMKQYAYE